MSWRRLGVWALFTCRFYGFGSTVIRARVWIVESFSGKSIGKLGLGVKDEFLRSAWDIFEAEAPRSWTGVYCAGGPESPAPSQGVPPEKMLGAALAQGYDSGFCQKGPVLPIAFMVSRNSPRYWSLFEK